MTPLLFISLVSIVLILMLYWILTALDSRKKNMKILRDRRFHMETSQELFKFVEAKKELEKNEEQEDKQ